MRVLLLLLCVVALAAQSAARPRHKRKDAELPAADSIMRQVSGRAPLYSQEVGDYRAMLYVRSVMDVQRKNFMLRYLPSMFKTVRGERKYIHESVSDLHFTAPNIYDERRLSESGTARFFHAGDGRLPGYFHLNIYSTYMLEDQLLSPLTATARRYYRYRVDSVHGQPGRRLYTIRFTPRYSSSQLVKGSMVLSEATLTVRRMEMEIYSEFFKCVVSLTMGDEDKPSRLLAGRVEVDGTFRFFGNKLGGHYLALLDFEQVSTPRPQARKNPYDLSSSYTLRTDTSRTACDEACLASLRPVPLTPDEREIYRSHQARLDSLPQEHADSLRNARWNKVGDMLAEPQTYHLNEVNMLRMSPLFNPFMLGYSPSRGISYSLRLRYQSIFSRDRTLRITPRVGYNFKQGDVYWNMLADYEYRPAKSGAVSLEVGNGNRSYSSAYLDYLKQIPDSIFDFNRVNLRLYNDLYLKLRHRWELTDGLMLDVKLDMHRRSGGAHYTPPSEGQEEPDLAGALIHNRYNSFAPGLRLTWTPGQYFYRNGSRKVSLHSRYPTISMDCEHGLKGIFPHSGNYGRLELELQHSIPLDPIRQLYYRLGWGIYSRGKSTYFIDYVNFRRSHLPTGWNDDIGGVFQLLDSRWYNSSRQYASANVTYEVPFLLFPYFGRASRHVFSERIYLGGLVVPHLKPYIEVGYGVGTRLFDVGVFASFSNWKYSKVGAKFTFELFDR